MTKFILLIVLMFFALGIAGVLLRRMTLIAKRIADLQRDMKQSQVRLDAQMQVLEEKQKQSESNDIGEKNS